MLTIEKKGNSFLFVDTQNPSQSYQFPPNKVHFVYAKDDLSVEIHGNRNNLFPHQSFKFGSIRKIGSTTDFYANKAEFVTDTGDNFFVDASTSGGGGGGGALPAGGVAYNVLLKNSATDGDVIWYDGLRDNAGTKSVDYSGRKLNDSSGGIAARWNDPGSVKILGHAFGNPYMTVYESTVTGNHSFALGALHQALGEGAGCVGTINEAKGRASFAQGRGSRAWGDRCVAFVQGDAMPVKGDTSMGGSAVAIGNGARVNAEKGHAYGNKVEVFSYAEMTLGFGNASHVPYNVDGWDGRDLLLTIGVFNLPFNVVNDKEVTHGQTNILSIWKSGHMYFGFTNGQPEHNGYLFEFAGTFKFSGKVFVGITEDTTVEVPANKQLFIHTGGVATLQLPDPSLPENEGMLLDLVNMGTGTVTVSHPMYLDATRSTVLLVPAHPDNKAPLVIHNGQYMFRC